MYVDDIIFGSTGEKQSSKFAKVMAKKFEMSMMGKLTFFLGLHVKKLVDEIFLYQAKYIANILKKFGFYDSKSTKTPMYSLVIIFADPTGADVNATLYRGMIGSALSYCQSS